MSSTLTRRATLPRLSPRWTKPDAAAAQGDRNEGLQAAREGGDGAAPLERFWRRLAAEGARDLLGLYGDCARLLGEQADRRERLRHELDPDLVGQAAANQQRHDERLATLSRELGPEAAIYKQRSGRAEEAQKALRAVRGEVNSRPLRTQFGHFYLLIMAVLALAEVPVNRAAFELTFREEPIFSLSLAVAVGIILICLAHVVGVTLRRWPRRPSLGAVLARVVALAVMLGVIGASMFVLAKMRHAFMQLTSAENDGFAQRLQEALRGTAMGTVSVVAELPFGITDWAFLAVNVLIFTFGVVASFLRHDPHPDYEKATADALRTDRVFSKVERRHGDAVRREVAIYEERKRSLESQMGEIRASLASLADQSDAIGAHCASARQMVAQTIRRRAGSFVDGFGKGAVLAPPSLETILDDLPAMDEADAAG